ncbi:hypothetical protein [Streptomyces sp. NBC_00306]|uniref:hypothetical protein n=1 Tax=Streptomyces sp. NBC_00306 TaxID=2975708 RepID=UPI002E2B5C8B|nr:hypothetical protein [Streptomyces sp. NBC_00306]
MDLILLAVELAFVALIVAGVALWSPPAAMILGGAMGVAALERVQAERKRRKGAGR